MKNALLVCILLFMAILFPSRQAFGQLQKGNYLVEGGFGSGSFSNGNRLSQNGSYNQKSGQFGISLYPRAGLFLTDRFVLGVQVVLGFGRSWQRYEFVNSERYLTSKGTDVNVGLVPFGRYYFAKTANGKSAFYGQLGVGIQTSLVDHSTSMEYDTAGILLAATKRKGKLGNIYSNSEISVGWNRFLTDNVAFNLNLGYNISIRKYSSESTHTDAAGVVTTYQSTSPVDVRGLVGWDMGLSIFFARP